MEARWQTLHYYLSHLPTKLWQCAIKLFVFMDISERYNILCVPVNTWDMYTYLCCTVWLITNTKYLNWSVLITLPIKIMYHFQILSHSFGFFYLQRHLRTWIWGEKFMKTHTKKNWFHLTTNAPYTTKHTLISRLWLKWFQTKLDFFIKQSTTNIQCIFKYDMFINHLIVILCS